jgi:hypothetical protein
LEPSGTFIAVTDPEDNLRKRSLTHFFPEILEVELKRYPTLDELDWHARAAGLRRAGVALAEGFIDLDDGFIGALEAKCSSGMRLMSDEAHRRGWPG